MFTSVVVKTVNLEIADDVSDGEFKMELQRFTAKQRKPDKMISDNTGQLKLAKAKLESMEKSNKEPKSATHVAQHGIT